MAHDEKNPLFSERVREQLLTRRILVLDGILDDDNGTLLTASCSRWRRRTRAPTSRCGSTPPADQVPSMLAIRDVMRLVGATYFDAGARAGLQRRAVPAVGWDQGQAVRAAACAHPHAPRLVGIGGSAVDIEVQADDLRHTVDTVLGLIAQDTGQPVQRIFDDSLHDHWYTAVEARDYGFIDAIVGSFGQVVPSRKHRIGLHGPAERNPA